MSIEISENDKMNNQSKYRIIVKQARKEHNESIANDRRLAREEISMQPREETVIEYCARKEKEEY